MIEAIEKNLLKGVKLLKTISNEQYSDASVAPYYSSIGCHMRHVLDMFSCIFEGLESATISLHKRKRNQLCEIETCAGNEYFSKIIAQVKNIDVADLNKKITVSDDMGMGLETVSYTLGAILMQANSHAIHHYASVGYLIFELGIELPDSDFGFNPTTPKKLKA